MTVRLRPYAPSDRAGVYHVCLVTDATGGETAAPCHDPDLPGQVYAGPYASADPGLAFVVTDAQGVGGYVVATADSAGFQDWAETHWWPALRERHPRRADPGDGTRDHELIDAIHAPPVRRPWFATHPAHLHIKLAARLQGRGLGRRLTDAVTGALRERGVPGVHLGVAGTNTGALAFYAALGFVPLHRHAWGHTLGLALDDGSHAAHEKGDGSNARHGGDGSHAAHGEEEAAPPHGSPLRYQTKRSDP